MRPTYGGNGQGPLETIEEPLYVSSPLGIRARIGMICRGCELEISGNLLTVDLRIMDMSEFDVILGMDWLTVYRVVVDCGRMRVTAYTQDDTRVVFQRASTIFSPDSIRVQVSGTVSGLASEPYPRGQGETDLDLPRVVSSLRMCGCFPDELPGLPPHRDVDFGIELHPGIFTHLYDSA